MRKDYAAEGRLNVLVKSRYILSVHLGSVAFIGLACDYRVAWVIF